MTRAGIEEQVTGRWKIVVAEMVDEKQVHAREGAEAERCVAEGDGNAVRFLASGAKRSQVEKERFGDEIACVALKCR